MQQTRQRILEHLRDRGASRVEALAEQMALAPVTVRHHLSVLRQRGLVEVEPERIGRGRPCHVYRISPSGSSALIGDRSALMATRILDLVKAEDDQAGERYFKHMAEGILAEHRSALSQGPIEARLDTLMDVLASEGFTARWERDGDHYLIHELDCPYGDLADAHAEVCCMDQALIQAVAEGRVVRERWRQDGDAACVFRLRLEPAAEQAESSLRADT